MRDIEIGVYSFKSFFEGGDSMTYKNIQEGTNGVSGYSISCYSLHISYSKTG